MLGCFSQTGTMNLHTAGDCIDQSAGHQRRSDADWRIVNIIGNSLMDNNLDHVYKTLDSNMCHQYADIVDEGFRYIL